MMITKSALWDAELTLREAGRDDLAKLISGLLDEIPGKTGNFINRENYVATVLWQDENIEQYLTEQGIEYDAEMVGAIADRCKDGLEDCSAGWDVISYEAAQYLQELDADREER